MRQGRAPTLTWAILTRPESHIGHYLSNTMNGIRTRFSRCLIPPIKHMVEAELHIQPVKTPRGINNMLPVGMGIAFHGCKFVQRIQTEEITTARFPPHTTHSPHRCSRELGSSNVGSSPPHGRRGVRLQTSHRTGAVTRTLWW